ncbi:hypothetical protein [Paractinoplanes ferrugineus]|nr:hypothetical protein [Actinoplanes ferrugineus]
MVLTGAVLNSDTGHTRRRMLGAGLAALTLGGCGVLDDDPQPPSTPDPLQPLADEALALAAAYDRTAASLPALATRLTPLAQDHRAHAAELAQVTGRTPAASISAPASAAAAGGSATDPATAVAALRAAEQTAAKNAVTACATTTAERAGLVGSIAACRATHVEALR